MGLLDRFRSRKGIEYGVDRHADGDEPWSPVRQFTNLDRQTKGPIRGSSRNSQAAVGTNHVNRAGRRMYVRLNQTRAFRRSVLGWGRWRTRTITPGEPLHQHAADTFEPHITREATKAVKHEAYRAERNARLGRR